MSEIAGVPKNIASNMGDKFSSPFFFVFKKPQKFWEDVFADCA